MEVYIDVLILWGVYALIALMLFPDRAIKYLNAFMKRIGRIRRKICGRVSVKGRRMTGEGRVYENNHDFMGRCHWYIPVKREGEKTVWECKKCGYVWDEHLLTFAPTVGCTGVRA